MVPVVFLYDPCPSLPGRLDIIYPSTAELIHRREILPCLAGKPCCSTDHPVSTKLASDGITATDSSSSSQPLRKLGKPLIITVE